MNAHHLTLKTADPNIIKVTFHNLKWQGGNVYQSSNMKCLSGEPLSRLKKTPPYINIMRQKH